MNQEDLWDELCQILVHHTQANDDCLETLNRLFRRIPALAGKDLPALTTENVRLTVDSRHKDDLYALITPRHETDEPPADTSPPIVVLKWGRSEYLLDGRRRILKWKRENENGDHTVISAEVEAEAH